MSLIQLIDQFLVITHVLAGITTLITGIICMVAAKGGKNHRLYGKIYFWNMFWIFVSALLIVFFFRFNFFLMVIAVLSFYAAFTGYRVLFRKKPNQQTKLDWAGAIISVIAGFGLILVSLLAMFNLINVFIPVGTNAVTILGIVFGIITASAGWGDIRLFRSPPTDKRWWWFYHMNAMLSSYVAATTAFLVQNGLRLAPPELWWLLWVGPAIIGMPLISYWQYRYRQQFAQRLQKSTQNA